MKKLIILFLLLPPLLFAQVSPSKIARIADANTVFGTALSYGTYLVVQSNNKTYKIISVNGVAGTAKLSDLVLNTDYIEEGTVTSVSTAAANNGVTATWSMASPTPALTIGLGAITPTSVNGLTLTALATGFTVAGGTTSKTLTVPLDASVSGTNTGDQTNITGNAATVTTNANLTGPVTSTGNATAIANGAISNAMLANAAVTNLSGTNTGDQTNITGNAGSATNLAGGAGGSIPYQSAAGTTVMLSNGAAGQVLQSNGTTLAPSWAAAGAGDMILSGVQTVTGAKTFGTSGGAVGKLIIAGSTSGSTILDATPIAGSGTVTLPTTGTLATLAGTEALTNKDLTSGTNTFPTFNQNTTGNAATVTTNANLTGMVTSSGNAATVVTNADLTGPITSVGNATSIASQTGTGTTFVMNTSPVLVTPDIGTPSAGIATNITGLPLTTGVTGILPLANGGSNANLTAVDGGVVWSNATQMQLTAAGTAGQILQSNAAAAPTWVDKNPIVKALSADDGIATTALEDIIGLDQPTGIGTYTFQYFIRYQAGVATTGSRFSVNYSGTVTSFVANMRWVDAAATASTNVPDQNAVAVAGQVMGSAAARTPSALGWGTSLSVDVINADMLMIIEGLMVVTVAGDIQLWHGSEVAATSTVMAGSSLILTKIQ